MPGDHGGPGNNVGEILGVREEPLGGGNVRGPEVGGDGGIDDVDVAGVAKPDGERVEEAGDGEARGAGAGVEREREGEVVWQEALEEEETEEKGAGSGDRRGAEERVDGGAGREVAGGEEGSVCAAEDAWSAGGTGRHGGKPGGGLGVNRHGAGISLNCKRRVKT